MHIFQKENNTCQQFIGLHPQIYYIYIYILICVHSLTLLLDKYFFF